MAEETESESRNPERPDISSTYQPAIPSGEISASLTVLSSELLALKDRLHAYAELDQPRQLEPLPEQLHALKLHARFAIALSVLSLIAAGMIAWFLWQALGVYRDQHSIMKTQASIMESQASISRNQVDAANFSNRLLEMETVANVAIIQSLPAVNGHASLTFKNTGQTSAKNLAVEVAYTPAVNPSEEFDPFVDARKTLDDLVNAQKQFILQTKREETLKIREARLIKNTRDRKATQERIKDSFEERMTLAQKTTRALEQRPFGQTYSDSLGELPANGSIDFPLDFHLGEQWLNDPSHFAYAFGTYRYEDQLGHIHHDLRFCYRFGSNGSIASCLQFQPSELQPSSAKTTENHGRARRVRVTNR
jgi:hypothetical protein